LHNFAGARDDAAMRIDGEFAEPVSRALFFRHLVISKNLEKFGPELKTSCRVRAQDASWIDPMPLLTILRAGRRPGY
jgi:hypothetical protein